MYARPLPEQTDMINYDIISMVNPLPIYIDGQILTKHEEIYFTPIQYSAANCTVGTTTNNPNLIGITIDSVGSQIFESGSAFPLVWSIFPTVITQLNSTIDIRYLRQATIEQWISLGNMPNSLNVKFEDENQNLITFPTNYLFSFRLSAKRKSNSSYY